MPALHDRCSLRSEARDEALPGTASTVPRWLLLESAGPWGSDGLRDARLPARTGAALHAFGHATRTRVLLIRRVDRLADVEGSVTSLVGDARGPQPWVGRRLLPSVEAALDLDLDDRAAFDPVDEPVAIVCTHGRRDVCCAERGRPLALATAAAFPRSTWESTHVGGDRFAANLVLFPHALYFGRVEAARGPEIVREYAEGRIVLERFRGRASVSMAAQTAEVYLRRELGIRGVEEVVVENARRDGDRVEVRLRADGAERTVTVRRELGDPMRLTCHSATEEPPVSWVVVR